MNLWGTLEGQSLFTAQAEEQFTKEKVTDDSNFTVTRKLAIGTTPCRGEQRKPLVHVISVIVSTNVVFLYRCVNLRCVRIFMAEKFCKSQNICIYASVYVGPP